MTSPKINGSQLELFAQDFFAALEPAPKAAPPQPLFRAPPVTVPIVTAPAVTPPAVTSPTVTPPTVTSPTVTAPPAPRREPNGIPLRRIQLGPHSLEFELRRSTRRSIGFMIDDKGLRVTAPKRITLTEIDNAIRAKQRWILTKLEERGQRRALRHEKAPVQWVDGAQLPYLGHAITLRLESAARSHCIYDEPARVLRVGVVQGLQEWQLKERVKIWYRDEASRIFTERLAHYAILLGVNYSALTLSSAGTRWGSCTVGGSIRLNWRLVHFSLPLIDYVVAHELAHLREMNHSPRFWATVASVYPDYDGAKEALRARSQELPVLFS